MLVICLISTRYLTDFSWFSRSLFVTKKSIFGIFSLSDIRTKKINPVLNLFLQK